MGDKRYYWLKLDRDFFKRHDVRIVEGMENGRDYIIFYLKLLCESIDHEGRLRFSDTLPYSESMLATITNTGIDTVRSAIRIFTELGMMSVMDDGTFFMDKVGKMIGSESGWAEKKRLQRGTDKGLIGDGRGTIGGQCPDNVQNQEGQKGDKGGTMSPGCPRDVRTEAGQCPIEKEKEKDIEIEKDIEYIDRNTLRNPKDDDDDNIYNKSLTARAREGVGELFRRIIGREAKPEEKRVLERYLEAGMEAGLVEEALKRAGRNGATAPAAYAMRILNAWKAKCIKTRNQMLDWEYLEKEAREGDSEAAEEKAALEDTLWREEWDGLRRQLCTT